MPTESNRIWVPLAIIVGAIIIGGALVYGLSRFTGGGSGTTGTTTPSAQVNIGDVKLTGEPFIGSATAPVTLAYWSDYQCPYCKEFETTVLPTLVTDYVNTGKLRIVFKDFQFLGPDSIQDGEYARAIWNLYPSLFFQWRTAMYTTQPEENSLSSSQNLARLQQVTSSISGINLSDVEANVASNKSTYDSEMQADEQEGESFGIQGTPGFITGTTLIPGSYPLSTYTNAIDAQLSK